MADIERLPCGVEHELRADAAIIRSWIDVANGPINREALADRLDRYANAAAELTAEIEALRAEVERVTCELMDAITRADKLEEELREAREFRDKLVNAIGNDQLRRFIEKHGEPVPLTIRMQAAEARAERLAEALRESHGEVLRLRAAMFRVYATAANGGNPTMYIEQMRDEMDKPWSGDKASAALEQEACRG